MDMLSVDGEFFHRVMTSLGKYYPLWLILSAYVVPYTSDISHIIYLHLCLYLCPPDNDIEQKKAFNLHHLLIISPIKS
jgi:hypothetical protein